MADYLSIGLHLKLSNSIYLERAMTINIDRWKQLFK